ncbi:putative ABC transporter C family member 15 [Camellia lanceoleosa]|uniref:ABC transporter C family member 15 n=1 Tax=Camellia lanceoleosa TaxID=1840588 RepID=A0ACC0I908_9ERIC|nr:putative ABC transporter C family member 15 [Camellia lanceoleosa]
MDQPLLHRENTGVRRDIVRYSNARIWSHITFRWLNPLFEKGQREKKLELSHIPLVPELEPAEKAFSKLQESMRRIYEVSSYMGPFLITHIHYVNFLSVNNDDASSYNHGLIIAFIFFIAKNMESVSQRQWYFGAQRVSVRIRAALMVLICKKSLSIKLSQSGPINWRIVNMINANIEKIGELCLQVHQVWLLPVQVFLALIILYGSLGAAPSMVALFTTVLVMVCNTPLAKRQKRNLLLEKLYHCKIVEAKDSRIKATSETFKSMRVLKLHSWESSFLKKLLGLRHTICMPSSNFVIEIEKGEYSWETNSKKPTVQISDELKIMKGYKVAICGSVGSGKSSLLCTILGEIPRISGWRIQVYGSRAYVLQSAWIQTGTVRDNVLFGSKMDEELYESVLCACALNKDVSNWVNGDLILVGERGTQLSGGQKPRNQLARAICSDSDVYFLDDPFSAECLTRLLSSKTVVYVTHQLEFFHAADLVLVMRDGMIVQSGKYGELMDDPQGELVRMMSSHENSLKQVNPRHTNSPESLKRTNDHEETQTGRVNWLVYSKFITSAYKGALMPVILLCQNLFVGMITLIFRASMSFFDSTPSSQILNRSSTDQSTMDTNIPYRLAGLAFALIQLFSIIILMCMVSWQLPLLFLLILVIFVWYQGYYTATARETARMVGMR